MRSLLHIVLAAALMPLGACLGAFSSIPPYSLLLAVFDGGDEDEDEDPAATLPPGRWLRLRVQGLNGSGLDIQLTPGVGAPENVVINAAGTHVFGRQFDPGESYALTFNAFPTPAHVCNYNPLGSENGTFGTTDPNEVITVTLNCFRNPSVIAVSPQALPNYGSPIVNTQSVRFVFNESMGPPGGCSVLGSMMAGATRTLATTNITDDTIVVTPTVGWNIGPGDLTIQACTSANGAAQAAPYNVQYTVVDASKVLYVRAGAGGTGLSAADPMGSIATAITQLNALCPPNPPCSVFVADGAYDVGGSGLQMTHDGVNLYGGYSSDFSSRDITTFATILEFQSACTSLPATVCAVVNSGGGVTGTTILQGFRIRGYRTAHTDTVGVRVGNGLLIGGNLIDGGNGTVLSIGIEQTGAGAVTMGANTIIGGLYDDGTQTFPSISGQAIGFRNAAFAGAVIVALNNQFIGGSSTGNATTGMDLANSGIGPAGGQLVNNVIAALPSTFGGDIGLNLAQALGAFRVVHNAIIAYSNIGTSVAFEMQSGASPTVANNHFQTGGAGPCVQETGIGTAPTIFEGNNVFGCTDLYDPNFSGPETTIAAVNSLAVSSGVDNTNVNPNYQNYAALNLRYGASPPCALTNGGANYLADAPQDYDNAIRTLPVSSGPYEYDSPPYPLCL